MINVPAIAGSYRCLLQVVIPEEVRKPQHYGLPVRGINALRPPGGVVVVIQRVIAQDGRDRFAYPAWHCDGGPRR